MLFCVCLVSNLKDTYYKSHPHIKGKLLLVAFRNKEKIASP